MQQPPSSTVSRPLIFPASAFLRMSAAVYKGLSLNPTKISGACGRLMCCLKYEQDTYEELLKVTPKQGAIVKTPEGTGSVEYVSLLKGLVKVKLDDENEKTLKEFNVADVKVLKKGKNNEPSEEEIGE